MCSQGRGRAIRVIAPSRSLAIVAVDQVERATERLEGMGFAVSFGKAVYSRGPFDIVPLSDRQRDLREAVEDSGVDIIMSAIGGYSSSELLVLLTELTWRVKTKIFVGNSDVSALLNYLSLASGARAICGPHFSSFGTYFRQPYLEEMFFQALDGIGKRAIPYPERFGSETWYVDRENWRTEENSGPFVVNVGRGLGRAVGGNLPTLIGRIGRLSRIVGEIILLIEIHAGYNFLDFIKWLHSVICEIGHERVVGLCVGKLPFEWRQNVQLREHLIEELRYFYSFPISIDLDFGHNMPFFSFEIGKMYELDTSRQHVLWSVR